MALRHARGRKATMPQLLEGQFAVTKDTEEVFAGINQKNLRVLDEKDRAALEEAIENVEVDTSGLATKPELENVAGQMAELPKTVNGITPDPDGNIQIPMPDLVEKSIFATNIVPNSDFSNGSSGWTGSNLTVTNNTLSTTGDGSRADVRVYPTTKPATIADHKMYISAYVMLGDNESSFAELRVDAPASIIQTKNNLVADTWYKLEGIYTNRATDTVFPRIAVHYSSPAKANGKTFKVKSVLAIDLTEMYGEGKEPNVQEVNKLLSPFLDGWFKDTVPLVIGSDSYLDETQAKELINTEVPVIVEQKIAELNLGKAQLGSKGNFKFKFPVSVGSSNISSHCMVGDEFWIFPWVNDNNSGFLSTQRYLIDFENNTQTLVGTFRHNWGHVNSVSYSPHSNAIILGNGSSDYSLPNKIFLFENADSFKDREQVDVRTDAIIIDCSQLGWGTKLNVVWGDSNNGKGNIAYAITNDNKNIRKIMLGKGTTQLENGQFVSGKSENQFNGTFKVLNTYSQSSGDDVNQGTCYRGGDLYIGLGHDILWYTKNKLYDNGSIQKEIVRETFYKDDGTVDPKTMQGITVTDNHILVGLQYGATNEIFVYSK